MVYSEAQVVVVNLLAHKRELVVEFAKVAQQVEAMVEK